MVPTGLSTTVK